MPRWLQPRRGHTTPDQFIDRHDAGVRLAERYGQQVSKKSIILGLPRGGVIVAAAMAEVLGLPLDVYLVRKLRAPINPEFAIGALAEDGEPVIDEEAIGMLHVAAEYVGREVAHQQAEIDRQRRLYRDQGRSPSLEGRAVVIVDDGIATGSTVEAAVSGLRSRGATSITVSAPVASSAAIRRLRHIADSLSVLRAPSDFWAVGGYYQRFDQASDEDVVAALARCRAR